MMAKVVELRTSAGHENVSRSKSCLLTAGYSIIANFSLLVRRFTTLAPLSKERKYILKIQHKKEKAVKENK